MKNLFSSRARILQAIRAACYALFLAAAAVPAAAQTATPDGNGNVTITGSGTYYYDGTNPMLSVGNTLTIDAASTLTNSSSQQYIISLSHGATVTNNGTLSANYTLSTSGAAFAAINVTEAAGDAINVNNTGTGTISQSYAGFLSSYGVLANGHGDVSISNAGGISSTSDYTGAAVSAFSSGGNVSISNTGSLSSTTTGTGGDFGVDAYGASATVSGGTGSTSITSSGPVTSSSYYGNAYGLSALNQNGINSPPAGPVFVSNSGTIGVSINSGGEAVGIAASSFGTVTVQNNVGGVISVNSAAYAYHPGTGSGSGYGIRATSTGSSTTITNAEAIGVTVSAYNQGVGIAGSAGGDLSITNSGAITVSTQAGAYTSAQKDYGILGTAGGAATVNNSGALNIAGAEGSYGIYVNGGSAALDIYNSATITDASSQGQADGIFAQVTNNTGNVVATNSSTISASGYNGAIGIATIADSGSVYVGNTGTITATTRGVSGQAIGLQAENSSNGGPVDIVNNGSVTASASYNGKAIGAQVQSGGNGANVSNGASGTLTATGGAGGGYGVQIATIGPVHVSNSGTMSGYADGNQATGLGINNSASTVYLNNSSTGVIKGVATYGANAYGIGVGGGGGGGSPYDDCYVANYGTVTASSVNGNATGIYVNVQEHIDLLNYPAGIVNVTSTGTGNVTGIFAESTSSNSVLDNYGSVTASNTYASGGSAAGLYAETQGTGGASVSNSGTVTAISANSNSSGILALAHGTGYAVAYNSGHITASGYDATTGMYAQAPNEFTSADNYGTVSATSTGTGEQATTSYGIEISTYGGGAQSSVSNYGTVTASAAYGTAAGIFVYGGSGSITIVNRGTATGTSPAYSAYGIYADGEQGGNVSITNNGAGVATATSSNNAAGIQGYQGGVGNVSIINTSTGLVSATSTAGGLYTVSGIYAYADSGSTYLKNTGTVTASGGNDSALYAYGTTGVTVNNSGALTATSAAGSYSYGIKAEDFGTGTLALTNSGQITSSGSYAYGISAVGAAGVTVNVDNSAAISVTASLDGHGIYAYNEGNANVSVTNSQAITVTASNGSTPTSDFYGIYAGTFTNPGDTTVSNTGDIAVTSTYNVYGIYSGATGTSSITNSAIITATGGSANRGSALYASGTAGATVTNMGALTASGNYAFGIVAKDAGSGAVSITNSGHLTSSGTYVYGIYASGSAGVAVTVSNTGAQSISSTYDAHGIYAYNDGNADVNVTNSGAITVAATNGSTPYYSFYGIYAGTFTNPGNVTVGNMGDVTVTSNSYVYGILGDSTGASTITNSATVSATSSGYYATGVYTTSGASNTSAVTNTGTLAATVNGNQNEGGAYGIDYAGAGAQSLTNGVGATISATANGGSGAYGIYTTHGTGNFTNNGAITASSVNGSSSGIYAKEALGVTVLNSSTGTITATTSGDGDGQAVYANSSSGAGAISVTNNGTIMVNAGDNADGMHLLSGTGTVTVSNTHNISSTGAGNAYGIFATTQGGNLTIGQSGTITTSASGGSASGIYAEVQAGNGTATLNTSGNITAASTSNVAYGTNIYTASGLATINDTGGTVSSSGYVGGVGLGVGSQGSALINISGNASVISVSSYNSDGGGGPVFGVYASGFGDASVIDTGTGTVTATSQNFANAVTVGVGVYSTTSSGYLKNYEAVTASGYRVSSISAYGSVSTTVINSGVLTTTGAEESGPAFGIHAVGETTGPVSVTNTGAITSSGSFAYGIGAYASNGTGAMVVSNTAALHVTGNSAAGIYASQNGGTISVTNSGHVTSSGYIGRTNGLAVLGVGTAVVSVNNTGAIDCSFSGSSGDSYGIFAASQGTTTVDNEAAIHVTSSRADNTSGIFSGTSSGSYVTNSGAITVDDPSTNAGTTTGIQEEVAGGNATIDNSAAISITTGGGLMAKGLDVAASSSSAVSLTNSGNLTITSASIYGALGISAYGQTVDVTNTGNITVSESVLAYGDFGIYAHGNGGDIAVTNDHTITTTSAGYSIGISLSTSGAGADSLINTGTISATGSSYTYGVVVIQPGSGAISIGNTHNISGTSTAQTADGVLINVSGTANVILLNSGTITGSAPNGGQSAYGAQINVNTGSVYVLNTGTMIGSSPGGVEGYGLYVDPVGPITVNNSGTITGTTYGIFLNSAGTVNNSGHVTGATNSIYVHSGSTVNLTGDSPINGLLKGGGDDTSTSTLNFNLTIRENFASAKAALDAAIADYQTRLAAAPKGPGDDVTSEVVVIDSSDYQWQDFADVTDLIAQGRVYSSYAGFAGLGTIIDGFSPNNAAGTRILSALDALGTNEGVSQALEQLSPKSLELFRNVAFDNNTFNVAKINNHLANLRDGETGFDTSQLTVNDSSMDPTLNEVQSHLLAWSPVATPGLVSDTAAPLFGGMDPKDAADTKAEVNTEPTNRWSAFISGDVILADLSNNPNLQNANYTTGNVMAGADYRIDKNFTVGGLFAYAHSDAALDSRGSSATVDSFSPGIYASYVDQGWYGNGLVTYGRNSYTEDRDVTIPGIAGRNHGGTSGNQGTANLTGGYEFQKGAFKFGPVATAEYVHLNIDSIQESGTPESLDIQTQNQDSLRTLFGLEARYVTDVITPVGRVTLTPHVSASWQHEYLDDSRGITSQFNQAGGGSFSVSTDTPSRDSAFFDLGLDATVAKNVTVFIDYQNQALQSNFSAQSAQGGVKIGF